MNREQLNTLNRLRYYRDDFNCANYAIGTEGRRSWLNLTDAPEEDKMLGDFEEEVKVYKLHEIKSINEAPKGTYVIIHKASYGGGGYTDFHWMVRKLNGQWYNKMGGGKKLKRFKNDIMKDWYCENGLCYNCRTRIFYQYKEDRENLIFN